MVGKNPELSGNFLKTPFCHQDLYVDHLTKDLDSKAQQAVEYEVQRSAQAQETGDVTKALSEVTVTSVLKSKNF